MTSKEYKDKRVADGLCRACGVQRDCLDVQHCHACRMLAKIRSIRRRQQVAAGVCVWSGCGRPSGDMTMCPEHNARRREHVRRCRERKRQASHQDQSAA